MKKLLVLTVLSMMLTGLVGCKCWDEFWQGSRYEAPPAVYCPPVCPPVCPTAGTCAPACPSSCGPVTTAPGGYTPGPVN